MKKVRTGLIIAILASVFFISFLIGRATALKKSSEDKKEITYNGVVPIPEKEEESVETVTEEEKVPDNTTREKVMDEEEKLPQKMLFPSTKTILKEYSQTAVYSETMGDWRAHTGIDYGADVGSEVKTVWKGTVSRVYVDRLWGNTVEISHSQGLVSVYKNLDENVTVKKGQAVEGGQVIGYVGNSASVESLEKPHLHFEIYCDGVVINPESYVY